MRGIRIAWLGILMLALGSCVSHRPANVEPSAQTARPHAESRADTSALSSASSATRRTSGPNASVAAMGGVLQPGTGVFINETRKTGLGQSGTGGEITLNFEETNLREVVGFILGELLQQNYVIDQRVQGTVTLHTSHPLAVDDLLPLLESLLQINSAALIEAEGGYQVVPMGSALLSVPAVGVGQQSAGGAGFGIQVVPLRYISAREMEKMLKPFVVKGAALMVDESRNLLIISATRQTIIRLLEMVRMFDVDWLKGMSLGLFPLKNAQIKPVIQELRKIFDLGGEGSQKNLLQFEPVERLNAVLVLSKQPRYLKEAERLIARLDHGNGTLERQLRIYHVKNGKAEYFADLLKQLFRDKPGEAFPMSVSAGEPARQMAESQPPGEMVPIPAVPTETVIVGENRGAVTIIPDPVNNSLLVMASAHDHGIVEAALNKLEIRPRQVLIEATIAEISLTGNLAYGLQWFLKHDVGRFQGSSQLGDFSVLGGGFTSAFTKDGQIRLLFDALASESRLKILSSPQLMVIDNQPGNIRVGDQIPIITRQTTSVTDADAPIVSEVQFRDTGVLLQVVPQIHAGGLVRLEVSIEVSEPSADAFAAGNVSILQRSLQSAIVVQSGDTVVLGGLILENETLTETGIPLLHKIPLIGKLFGRTVDDGRRTELMVTLTPRVIESQAEAQAATEELRDRLRNLGYAYGED